MQNKIALEEHFSINELVEGSETYFMPQTWLEFEERILDIHKQRLVDMAFLLNGAVAKLL